nr:MAG TPA: hypothetical protein [Caudoviricetes sp.]
MFHTFAAEFSVQDSRSLSGVWLTGILTPYWSASALRVCFVVSARTPCSLSLVMRATCSSILVSFIAGPRFR